MQAHIQLKEAIVTAPVLALPRKQGAYVLETDASAAQLGVQLLQQQEDKSYRPLGYWSRQCNAAERNYSPTEREALAIVWGIKVCRPYLERTSFVVRSDHQALRWLFSTSSSDGNPRGVRWKLALSAFSFTVEYKPGASHKVPDELSRMKTKGLSQSPSPEDEEECIPCLVVSVDEDSELLPDPVFPRPGPLVVVPNPLEAISLEDLLEAQAKDEWCARLYQYIESEVTDTKPPGLFLNQDGVLCCAPQSDIYLPERFVTPASLRERLCVLHHFTRVAGHPGIT
jgi:RNase H-like domain found in reverse transcriptase